MSDLPRLLLCCFDVVPAPTAISRRLTEYVKGLSDRYQVVVLSAKTPDHTHIERYHGARLLRVPVGAGDLAARAQAFDRAVRRQLDSEEYVLVHFFDPFGGYALCERRAEFDYKLIYDACTMPSAELPFLVSEEEANRRFLAKVRRQELFCLMNADAVVVGSELTRDYVCGLGVAREQVHVLPAPVDLGPYAPAVMGQPDATPMTLLHLGNQGSSQDLPTVLEALQLALQTVDVRLTVVGPRHAEHQARLEELVVEHKLTGKVEFQPPVAHDDLHKVLATADVGLLTLSDVERNSRVGSPLSRLGEYLAAGRPVIAADVASARAQLPEDGVVLYRPEDPSSLADAIVTLATDPARRVKLGAAARTAASSRDAAKVRADLTAIYVGLSGTGVRAVGDEEPHPDEVTQLGATTVPPSDTGKKRLSAAPREHDSSSGTAKVRTDPAIVAEDTSPEVEAGAGRPAVMGVPLREEPPPPLGPEAQALARELAEQVTTEPNAVRPTEPPVVMGSPLPTAAREVSGPTPGDLAAELGEVHEPRTKTAPLSPPTGDSPEPEAPAGAAARAGAAAEEELPSVIGVPMLEAPAPAPGTEEEEPPAVLGVEELPMASDQESELPSVLGVAFEPVPTVPLSAPDAAPVELAAAPSIAPESDEAPAVGASPSIESLPDEPAPAIALLSLEDFAPAVVAPRPAPVAAPAIAAPPPAPVAAPAIAAPPVAIPSLVVPPLESVAAPAASARATRPIEPSPAAAAPPSPADAAAPRTSTPAPLAKPRPDPTSERRHVPTGLFPESPQVPGLEEAESIDEDEILAVDGDGEPEEVSADEVLELPGAEGDGEPDELESESFTTVDTDASPPPSAIDPWLAQLVHGYCPPEADLFDRHTPPTTMPGRDT